MLLEPGGFKTDLPGWKVCGYSPADSLVSGHYDFLCRIRRCLLIRLSAPTDSLPVRSHAAESTAGPGPAQARYHWLSLGWSHTGAPRFLENPSRTFAPLSDPGQFVGPRRSAQTDAAPTLWTVKAPAFRRCRDSITQLRYPLPTLQTARCRTVCKARFRPEATLCREGVEPSGLHRKVSIRYIGFSPLPGFAWRYRESPTRTVFRLISAEG